MICKWKNAHSTDFITTYFGSKTGNLSVSTKNKSLKHVMSNAVPDKRDHNYMEQHKHCVFSHLST